MPPPWLFVAHGATSGPGAPNVSHFAAVTTMTHVARRSLTIGTAILALLTIFSSCGGSHDLPTSPGGGGAVVTQIVVSPATGSLIAGQSLVLTAVAKDGSGNAVNQPLSWSTSDATVATVTNGTVNGLKAGGAMISATNGVVTGTATLTVLAAVANVVVTPSPATVVINTTTQLVATPQDALGTALAGRTVTWSSSDTTIATVSASGLVSGKALGNSTITATADGKVGSTVVTVRPIPVATITITPVAGPLTVGDVKQLTATLKDAAGNVLGQPVTWTSSSAAVATVSATGLLTAKAAGTTTITASADGKSGTLDVAVAAPKVASVTLSPASLTLAAGQSSPLAVTLKDAAGTIVTDRAAAWTSSDQTKATVTSAGVVNALSQGTVTITATSEGQSGVSTVLVVDRTPPTVQIVATDPTAVDVSSGAKVVVFSAKVLDFGGSGVQRVDFLLTAPARTQNNPAYTCTTQVLSSGTPANGVWSCAITIPTGSAPGDWTISIVALDAALNRRSLTSADLAAAATQSTLSVASSTQDVTPPAVVGGLNGIPPQVDVTSAPVSLTVSAQLTDAQSGVARFDVGLRAPDGKTSVSCSANAPTSGTPADGIWQCTLTIPKGAQPGNWSIAIRAIDAAFNTYASISPSTLTVVNTAPDITPPAITSLTVSPTRVDLTTGAQVVTATARITDAETGVATFLFRVTAPDNTTAQCVSDRPATGTIADGTWTCQITIPPGVPAGDWAITVEATDKALNVRTLRTAELTAAGFPTKVTVVVP